MSPTISNLLITYHQEPPNNVAAKKDRAGAPGIPHGKFHKIESRYSGLYFDNRLYAAQRYAIEQVNTGAHALAHYFQQGNTAEKAYTGRMLRAHEVFLIQGRIIRRHKGSNGIGCTVHLISLTLGGIVSMETITEKHLGQVMELRVGNQAAPQSIVLGG